MQVRNVHERRLGALSSEVGALVDLLASPNDRLWPKRCWPRMKFDRPLGVGAVGGHGPIRYSVEEYRPGHYIRFRFTKPAGFVGFHAFEVLDMPDGTTLLRHVLEMDTHSLAIVSWPLAFRWMHDALIEDALTTAEVFLQLPVRLKPWSPLVRFLRWAISAGKTRPQHLDSPSFDRSL